MMTSTSKLISAVCWSGVGVVAAAFVAFGYITENDRRQHAIRPEDGCLAYAPPPAVTLILNDRTDPLTGDQPRRWRAAVNAEVARLPPGSVLLVGSIGPTAQAEMPLEKLCVPLVGRGARAAQLQSEFNRHLDAITAELKRNPSTSRSAISASIVAAASDVAFQTKTTGPKRIEVNTDLLENDVASAYRAGGITLPTQHAQALKGSTIHFNVLRNVRDSALQTRPLIEAWTQWARSEGATCVEVDAPWLGHGAPTSVAEADPS